MILPCPFCGRPPSVGRRASNVTTSGDWHSFSCFGGGYSSHAYHGADTYEGALASWNARHQPSFTITADDIEAVVEAEAAEGER